MLYVANKTEEKIYENLPQRTTGQEKEPCLPPKETLELKKYRSMNIQGTFH